MSAAQVLMALQVAIGVAVAAGAVVMLTHAIDAHTPRSRRALFIAILVAGVWYAVEPLVLGIPTSTKPGLLFAGFTAWSMLMWRHTLCAEAGLK